MRSKSESGTMAETSLIRKGGILTLATEPMMDQESSPSLFEATAVPAKSNN